MHEEHNEITLFFFFIIIIFIFIFIFFNDNIMRELFEGCN